MREISILKQRILDFIEFKGISKYECYKNTGITNGVLSQSNGMSEENLLRFLSYYTEVNPDWLLTGRGSMLRDTPVSAQTVTEPAAIDNSESKVYYNMYKEKDSEASALKEEVGKLKERIRQLESEPVAEKFTKKASTQSSKAQSGVAGSAGVHLK